MANENSDDEYGDTDENGDDDAKSRRFSDCFAFDFDQMCVLYAKM